MISSTRNGAMFKELGYMVVQAMIHILQGKFFILKVCTLYDADSDFNDMNERIP